MPDGKVKHVHENKFCEFVVNSSPNAIFERDDDFGEVNNAPVVVDRLGLYCLIEYTLYLFTQQIKCLQPSNLSDQQTKKLKSLFSTLMSKIKVTTCFIVFFFCA